MLSAKIVGQSSWSCAIRQRIALVAEFSSSVLIHGPSGTGKELIARAIHEQSPRAAQPFIPVDCTSLTGELFASHLFGHVKGAFTGAQYERLGCFRAANQGTILLDEIGELSLDLQAKLLRVIQERVVVPVGSEAPVPVDVRIIAATNRDLADEVRRERFRLDLYYRLNVVSIETRALTERRDEIPQLAAHFLDKLTHDHGLPHKRFSAAALAALLAYPWPGNVRELQNVVERAVIFAAGSEIDVHELPFDRLPPGDPPLPHRYDSPAAQIDSPPLRQPHWSTLADVEREHICVTLARTANNQSAAADLLGIDRSSLARKISRYAIPLPSRRRGRPRNEPY